jgi:hypothetical protein
VLLTREGWKVGKKLVYNLYREDRQSWWRPLPAPLLQKARLGNRQVRSFAG